jgi:SAM-dependent methyltransferase
MSDEPDTHRLARASLAEGDATGWFEKLYAEAADGTAEVPWDRESPSTLLAEWAALTYYPRAVIEPGPSPQVLPGKGKRALVIGCGPGRDAEFIASLGFDTVGFDISETAIRVARERHPGTPVDYRVANLLDLPPEWTEAFDLVVESNNIQALPRSLRPRAIAAVGTPVSPGGMLVILAAGVTTPSDDGPPWPLTRQEVESFATGGLQQATLDEVPTDDDLSVFRWCATFTRPTAPTAGTASAA